MVLQHGCPLAIPLRRGTSSRRSSTTLSRVFTDWLLKLSRASSVITSSALSLPPKSFYRSKLVPRSQQSYLYPAELSSSTAFGFEIEPHPMSD
jgi:hypothetical protein